MNYLDLFHGILGFSLGAYWSGIKFENHFVSDKDIFCQKLAKLRFPNSIQLGDITEINLNDLRIKYNTPWIVTAGFPCQPFSQAGKKLGENDERNLWPYTKRVIQQLIPRFIILENVIGAAEYIFGKILPDLEKENYKTETIIFRVDSIKAPHRRKRFFIIAYSNSNRFQGINTLSSKKKINPWGWDDIKRMVSKVQSGGIDCIPESWIIRKGDGIPGRVDRSKGLGNSIVPQIAELLFRLIKNCI